MMFPRSPFTPGGIPNRIPQPGLPAGGIPFEGGMPGPMKGSPWGGMQPFNPGMPFEGGIGGFGKPSMPGQAGLGQMPGGMGGMNPQLLAMIRARMGGNPMQGGMPGGMPGMPQQPPGLFAGQSFQPQGQFPPMNSQRDKGQYGGPLY